MSYAMLMAVTMSPREDWTDQRLDDLNKKVDDGFERVDRRFAEAKAETGKRFDRVERRMENGFAELNQRFDRMQHTLIGAAAVIAAALIGTQL